MINTIPEECAKMEEGIIDEAVPSSTASNSSSSSCGKKRLSAVSKKYDIDGDGKLDEAELAMRAMDKSGRGHLTNEKVYSLMQEQLKMQKSLFQMKKVIAGLLVFVVILALSNLGTSFASAILAKDTTTSNSSGSPQLVDKKTGETVATDQAVKRFTAEVVPTEDDEPFTRGLARTNEYGVTTSSFSRMLTENAQDLLGDCAKGNKIVKLTYSTWTARTVCGIDWTCQSTFTYPADRRGNPDPISGVLCLQGTSPMEYVHVYPDTDDSTSYIISADDPNFLTSDLNDDCAANEDCDDGLVCSSNICVVPLAKGDICAGEDTPDCDTGLECSAEPACPAVDPPGRMALATTYCGSATSTVASVDPCEAAGLPFCNSNNVCGRCNPDVTTTCPTSTRPACVDGGNGVYSCGCGEDADCSSGETCGIPDSKCVADISPYCSADHDADYGCNTFTVLTDTQIELGVSISTATCQESIAVDPYEPACDDSAAQCAGTIPSGCSCKDIEEEGCGYHGELGIKYCNQCVAEMNGAVWVPTVPVLAEGVTCSFMEDSPNCDTGLECVAEAKFESASFPVSPVSCGATTTTTSTGTASTDSNVFTSYSEDCSNSDSGDICHNNICGFCDDSTCDANSNRPNCVAEDGRASYCGCTSDNDCDDNESCGVPSSSCVADITNYCSADHDADYGCGLVNLLDGERVSLTCKVPTCGSETCTSILPDGVVCTENIEDGCGSDDIHYCNSCIAVANGAEWIATKTTTVPPK